VISIVFLGHPVYSLLLSLSSSDCCKTMALSELVGVCEYFILHVFQAKIHFCTYHITHGSCASDFTFVWISATIEAACLNGFSQRANSLAVYRLFSFKVFNVLCTIKLNPWLRLSRCSRKVMKPCLRWYSRLQSHCSYT
jgi:hypothetical protein